MSNIIDIYKPLMESVIDNIDIEDLLDNADGYDYREDAEDELKYLLNHMFNDLEGTITLYRVIFSEDGNLDTKSLGIHWTDEKIDSDHIDYIRDTGSYLGTAYIVTAIFNKSDINVESTLYNRMRYPHENEITLNKEATPIEFEFKEYE